jgi:Holliday junction resolvase RusA-like endonuclease
MRKNMKFILYTKPCPINQKFGIFRGRNILSKKYRDTKYALAMEIRSQGILCPYSGILEVTLVFHFGDKRKRDVDAYIKIILDAMEGLVYDNDNQIVELLVYKQIDLKNPRTEVEIYERSDISGR